MIRFTERDFKIKEFLKDVVVADTETIHKIFFQNASLRTCQARLKLLVDYKFIKAYRSDILSQNIYYLNKKPSSYKHKIVFSQLLGILTDQGIEILKYVTPLKVGNVIADGFIAARIDGEVKIYFVEVELTKYFDLKKYQDLYYSRKYKEKFPVMPSILVITNKSVKTDNKLNIKVCKLDLSDLKL